MEQKIAEEIARFVREYQNREDITTVWGVPEVGYADVFGAYVRRLREVVSPSHVMPEEVLPDATVVLVYYIPFTKELAKTNAKAGRLAAPEWAIAYEETNAMFQVLNEHLIELIKKLGYKAVVSLETKTFDKKTLMSNWSHRHFAYAAGMGTFGINNMLLTKQGCCGRFFSIVTNLPIQGGEPRQEELCLYKKNGSCGVCVRNCPVGALTRESYDRKKCYGMLQENAKIYTDFGSSYMDETGGKANSQGSDVCGKCITASPCMFWEK